MWPHFLLDTTEHVHVLGCELGPAHFSLISTIRSPSFRPLAPWTVNNLFHFGRHPQDCPQAIVKPNPLALWLYECYEFRLSGYGGSQRDSVTGVTMGTILWSHIRRAAWPGILHTADLPVLLLWLAGGVIGLLPIHNNWFFVQMATEVTKLVLGVIWVKRQRITSAEFKVHAGTDGNGLEDFQSLRCVCPKTQVSSTLTITSPAKKLGIKTAQESSINFLYCKILPIRNWSRGWYCKAQKDSCYYFVYANKAFV